MTNKSANELDTPPGSEAIFKGEDDDRKNIEPLKMLFVLSI